MSDLRAGSLQPFCPTSGSGHIPLPKVFQEPIARRLPQTSCLCSPSPSTGRAQVACGSPTPGHTPMLHLSAGPEG